MSNNKRFEDKKEIGLSESRRIRTLNGTSHTLDSNTNELPPRVSAASFRGYLLTAAADEDNCVITEIKKPPVDVNGVPKIPFFDPTDQNITMSKLNESWILPDKDLARNLISTNLRRSFTMTENPFSDALFFVVHSRDFRGGKVPGSLAYRIVAELKQWLMDWDIINIQRKCLTPELQIAAFMIVTLQKSPDLIGIVCDVFRFDLIRGQLTKPILELCRAGKYTEACHVATFADVTIDITVHEFVLPLLLQDLEIVTSAYVADHVDIQRELLLFLEETNGKKDIYRAMKDYVLAHNIEVYKPEKLEKKQFDKMYHRFNTKYHSCLEAFVMDEPETVQAPLKPNILQGTESFTNLKINDNLKPARQINWFGVAADNNKILPTGFQTIAAFERFAATQTLNGEPIRTIFTGQPNTVEWDTLSSSSSEFNFGETIQEDCYNVEITKDKFFMFTTAEEVRVFIKHLMAAQIVQRRRSGRSDDYLVVTLEAKWNIYGTLRKGVSILAVGLVDEVYMIDLFRLKDSTKKLTEAWDLLRGGLFMNTGIVKVGYHHDKVIDALTKSHPTWANLKTEFRLFVDLGIVANVLISKKKNFFPNTNGEKDGGFGISDLVHMTLGKFLDQSVHMSNWEERPSSKPQIYHTALDAFVIFDVLEAMVKRATNFKVDFEGAVIESMTPRVYSNSFNIPGRTKMFPGKGIYSHPVSPGSIKVVCDGELKKLGRQLRAVGMDCLIGGENGSMLCIKLAQRDRRSIIMTPEIWELLSGEITDIKCCVLLTTTLTARLEETLKHFNVYVNETDLFTHCQACNSNRFIAISNRTMKRLVKRNKREVDPDLVAPDINVFIPACDERCRQFKKWTLIPECKIMIKEPKNIRTSTGVPIVFQFLTPAQLENVRTFVICDQCGQIYLDESEHEIAVEPKYGLKNLPSATSRVAMTSRPGFGVLPRVEDTILEAMTPKKGRKSKQTAPRPGTSRDARK